MSPDDHASPRRRDPMRREDADWERRRSRSPSASEDRGKKKEVLSVEMEVGKNDLGSFRLSGALLAADGAPPPPPTHPDPMMDFFKDTCVGDIWAELSRPLGG